MTSVDENGQTTSYQYDSMNRLTQTTPPSPGAQVNVAFGDSAVSPTVSTSNSFNSLTGIRTFDGLGRLIEADDKNGSMLVSSVTYGYDGAGRRSKTSNPFGPSETALYTNFSYDGLGRVTQVSPPSGGSAQYQYSGNAVTLTDPAGKQRRNITDALGRLIEVDEPNVSDQGVNATASVTISGALSGTPATPAASGRSMSSLIFSDGSPHTFYVGTDQHIWHLFWNAGGSLQNQDVTALAAITEGQTTLAASGSALTSVIQSGNNMPHVFYLAANQHVNHLWLSGSVWSNEDLTSSTGNTPAAGGSALSSLGTVADGLLHVFYLGTDQHIYRLFWNTSGTLQKQDVTAAAAITEGVTVLAASGSALTTVIQSGNSMPHLFYLDANQHVNHMWLNNSAWGNEDLSAYTGNTAAASGSALTSLGTVGDGLLHAFYLGTNQHVYRLFWNTSGSLQNQDLSAVTGNTLAASGSSLTSVVQSGNNMPHVFYLDGNQHVNHMWLNGSTWGNQDLASLTGNVAAISGSPLSSLGTAGDGLLHAFYLSANRHVHRLFWNNSSILQEQDVSTAVIANGAYDAGTVSLTVGNFTATACYGQSTNSACTGQPTNVFAGDVASALAQALNVSGSPASATPSGSALNLTWNAPGAVTPVVSALSTTHDNASLFPNSSFSSQPANFAGGGYPSLSTSPMATTYSYDVLDNLIAVSQAAGTINGQSVTGQPRSYSYDNLGRQITATTPESGTVNTYYTDANGAACSGDTSLACRVQDARGVVKTFTYDAINRPTGVQYSDGTPSVTYTYDTGGAAAFALNRLVKITEGATSTQNPPNSQTFAYDNLGRITSVSQVIDQATYLVQYSYNAVNQPISITYPTNRVVSQAYDAIGRLSSVADGSTTYLNGLSFNAAGEALAFTYGNNVQGALGYNDHLQLAALRYYKSGSSTDILNLAYDYGANNNGQIQTVRYYTSSGTEDATKSEYFSYDGWSRLDAAHTGTVNSSTPGTWSLTWEYDRLGNRLKQNVIGGNTTGTDIGQPQFTVDVNTNRITNTGFAYDTAGNLTGDGTNTYTYDGASRLKHLTNLGGGTADYTYFGPLRIKKVVGSTTTLYVYSGSKPIVEYVNGSLSKEYIYSGSGLLATLSSGGTTYHHPDHLSNRAETDASGSVTRSFGHAPFGEKWYETGTADKSKFTAYERDAESGLDYARFRYYGSGQGRFLNADLFGGSIGAPQSLNRYAYVMNAPVNLVDPLGLWCHYSLQTTTYSHSGIIDNGPTSVTTQVLDYCIPDEELMAWWGGVGPPNLFGGGGGDCAKGDLACIAQQRKPVLLVRIFFNPDCAQFLGGGGKQAFHNAIDALNKTTYVNFDPANPGAVPEDIAAMFAGRPQAAAYTVVAYNRNPIKLKTATTYLGPNTNSFQDNEELDAFLLHEVSHGAQPTGDLDPKDANYADLYAHIKQLCPDPGKPK